MLLLCNNTDFFHTKNNCIKKHESLKTTHAKMIILYYNTYKQVNVYEMFSFSKNSLIMSNASLPLKRSAIILVAS